MNTKSPPRVEAETSRISFPIRPVKADPTTGSLAFTGLSTLPDRFTGVRCFALFNCQSYSSTGLCRGNIIVPR